VTSQKETGAVHPVLARSSLLAATTFLPDGYHKSIGINVLGDPNTKHLLGFLKAKHVSLDQGVDCRFHLRYRVWICPPEARVI